MVFDQIRVLHHQLESIALVLQQMMKQKLEPVKIESKNQKANQEAQMYNQITLVTNWIKQFEPSKIDDCFGDEQTHEQYYLQKQIIKDNKKIQTPKITDSFNKKAIKDIIKKQQ